MDFNICYIMCGFINLYVEFLLYFLSEKQILEDG